MWARFRREIPSRLEASTNREVDWFAAEQAVYTSLVASGMITTSLNDPQNMREKIYG